MDQKPKIGVVVGRFQPLHPGHVRLMQTAYDQCDQVRVVIGSTQYVEPLPVEERRRRIVRALEVAGWDKGRYEIIELPDIHNLPRWPQHLKETCKLTNETDNLYFTADQPSADFLRYIEMAGFTFCLHDRPSFIYRGPDGREYEVRSATEIRELHRQLGAEDKL